MDEGAWIKKIKWMKNLDGKIINPGKSEWQVPIKVSIRY